MRIPPARPSARPSARSSARPSVRRTVPLVVATGLALTGLSACGGSSSDGADPTTDPAAAFSQAVSGRDDCQATVALTGAVNSSWSGGAALEKSDSDIAPPASYLIQHDDLMFTVFSEGHGFHPSVLISQGGQSFGASTQGGDPVKGTLDVADDGSGAHLDVDANSVTGGDPVHVKADITC